MFKAIGNLTVNDLREFFVEWYKDFSVVMWTATWVGYVCFKIFG